MRLSKFVAGVFVLGVVLAGLIGAWATTGGMDAGDVYQWLSYGFIFAGLPTLIAALPTWLALVLTAVLAAYGIYMGWQSATMSGDGGIGGIIVIGLTGFFVLLAFAIIGLRRALVGNADHA